MSRVLTAVVALTIGVLLGVLLRDAAAHDDSGLLGWEWFVE